MKPLLLVAISFLPFSTFAMIDIQPHILEIQQANAVVTVINNSSRTEYIRVQLYRIDNPGESPEKESLISVGSLPNPLLFAAPAKLTLGPKQSGKILLKALQPPDKEQIYRLAVIPENNVKVTGGQGAVLSVQLNYMGLVRHLPISPQPQWQHQCIGGKPELYNSGNIRLHWRQLNSNGQEIDDFNLYPGQQQQLATSHIQGIVEGKPFNLRCTIG